MSEVKCNCAWNPDSHHETCPVYMRDRIADLAADNQRLAAEVGFWKALAHGRAEKVTKAATIALSIAEKRDQLKDANQRLREALEHIRAMQLRGFLVLGDKANGLMKAALTTANGEVA
jgi:hypothetical protein